jgi:hypothetical protein
MSSTVNIIALKSDVEVSNPGDLHNYHSEGRVWPGQVRKLETGGYCLVIRRDGRRPAWVGGPSLYHYHGVPCGPPLAARQDARRKEIERLVRDTPQVVDARMQTWDRGEMVQCWGAHRLGGHEAIWADTTGRLVYETSHYDDGPAVWQRRDVDLAAEAIQLKK